MQSSGNHEGRLSRWTVTTGAWVLAGMLVIVAALIFSARAEERIYPSITNVRPSGYAAFFELLRRDGYEVTLDRGISPKFERGDVVVSTTFGGYDNDDDPNAFFTIEEEVVDADLEGDEPWDDLASYESALVEHLESGGTVISVFSRMNFKSAEDNLQVSVAVTSASDPEETYRISIPYGQQRYRALPYDNTQYVGWFSGEDAEDAFVTYTSVEGGLLVQIQDGLGLCNRYLDKDKNAEFYLSLFREVAPPGSRFVFIEAGIGNVITPSVTNTLGGWAVAARWQLLLLFVVLVFTLAKRFGLPEREKRDQRGSRELFDAIADVFRRSNNTGLALDNLLIEVDERIRSVIRAPSTLTRSLMLQRVPVELKEQYLNVSELAVSTCGASEAAKAAQKLVDQLEEFENDSRSARGLKR